MMKNILFITVCFCLLFGINASAKNPHKVFNDLPSKQIVPNGWAKEFLNRQISGLTGHPEESGFPYNKNGWIDGLNYKDREIEGGNGWFPYEQVAYYLDGSLRCGYLTNTLPFINNAQKNIDFLLSTADKEGQFHIKNIDDDWWPLVVFIRMMVEQYKNTNDPRILNALVKHYKSTYSGDNGTNFVFTGFSSRSLLHIENLCNLYMFTKDKWFIETAERLYNTFEEKSKKPQSIMADGMLAGMLPSGHAVTYHEFLKLPIVLYYFTGKQKYRDAFERAFDMLNKNDELADGLSSGVEHLMGNKSNMAHETCNSIDYNWTCGWALLATGDAKYADKMEKNIYNAGFSSITPDFRAHQYYCAPNLATSTSMSSNYNDNTSWGLFAKKRLCYRPGHDTECCSGNIHRMLPTFINRSSMTFDKGVYLNFYLPGQTSINIGKKQFKFEQQTNYPFDFSSKITIIETPNKKFDFGLRIPGWATSFKIFYNGIEYVNKESKSAKYYVLSRKFQENDVIEISFQATPIYCDTSEGVAVNYGPLVYSYEIDSKCSLTTHDDAGKCSETFPAYEFIPKDPSSCFYGLLTKQSIEIEHLSKKGYPWDYDNSPILLKVKAKKVKNWGLSQWTYLTEIPKNLEVDDEVTTLTLHPMGATFLRITDFPKIKE